MSDPSPNPLLSAKRDMRRAMEKIRAEACAKNPDAGLALRDNFLKAVALPPQSVIAGYSARGNEINPAALVAALRAQGHTIALPVMGGATAPLVFRIHKDGDKFAANAFGIREPETTAPLAEPDILLVPLLAFDRRGHRLGYGGGYYDRTLHELRRHRKILAIGVGFACQEVPEVPAATHDVRLDRIVTETQAFDPTDAIVQS